MCTDSGNPENAFGASPKKGFDFINTSPHQLMAFGLSEAEPTPAAPFKFQPHSPGQSPEKTSEPKGFWDEPAPSTPPKTFFFGPQTQTNVPPPPKGNFFV